MKKSINTALLYRRIVLLIYDVLSVTVSVVLALMIRHDFSYTSIDETFLESVYSFLPVTTVITLLVFMLFRLYNSLWAFASVSELQNIVMACGVTTVLNGIGLALFQKPVPRSFPFLFFFLLVGLTFASRFSYRFFRNLKQMEKLKEIGANIMIIGAGEAANMIIKEIKASRYTHMRIRCIIDDDPNKQGRYIQGIKVVGGREKIKEAVDSYDIDEIFIAMPSVSRSVISEFIDICKDTECKIRTLPGMYQLVNGEVNVSQLKEVDVEDLLGRDPIVVDLESILGYVKGRCVLVTGGGGSIGSELCRQIAAHKPSRLIVVDIYENNAYDIQQELKQKYPELELVVLIASVRNTYRMNRIFEIYQPELVYHAAAHKHVPLMEDSPNEAIKNNVMGTWKTAMAAANNGVKKFVLISTDKAVNPTNIMGASKRICEMIIQTFNKHYDTEFVAVRFGNVLGSNGSVIPLFKRQIAAGGPVTVTHPDIIRYFMTIPEAVSLVLQAGAYAKGGEIFILDMGKPVRILDLAKNLIRLSGFKVDEDIKIEFTGLRPGEKLYEELLMDEEGLQDTANSLIYIGRPIEIDEEQFFMQLKKIEDASRNEEEDIRRLIKDIVPTYCIKQDDERKVDYGN
ncbi:MAG: polysaccharide biosynthesis protein [Lachnospiraceae bacterium]|nr:polysaccharide biosynthesis protein [Lachnospiraceae bacterium]